MRMLVFVLMLLLMFSVAASAHVYLLECEPAENAVLSEAPSKAIIRFAGSVESAFSKVEVFDASGKKVSKKTRFLDRDMLMEADLEPNLPAGSYTVKWKCMSLDGHSQTSEYTFTIQ